jgi:hypothetical protein
LPLTSIRLVACRSIGPTSHCFGDYVTQESEQYLRHSRRS